MAGRLVRVGVDAAVREALLAGFPAEATMVRIPAEPTGPLEVDLWILPFYRRDAAAVFATLRGVKVVQSLMAGVDWIMPWLPKEVTLCDGRGIHDSSTSEWVVGAILASLKRFPLYRDRQAAGVWRGGPSGDELLDRVGEDAGLYRVLGDDLAGKTVLIVGYGAIGAAIEERLLPFGVRIVRVARRGRAEPEVLAVEHLRRLLPEADVVVTIVPMTAETRGLIGAEEMALMRRGALLVNAARGPVVVTEALVEALEAGHLRAAVDVTDPEPLPEAHPLWRAPNCLITPHVGGSTPEFLARAFRLAARQVARYVAGEQLDNVVRESGY